MFQTGINKRLWLTLGLCWLAFAIAGILMNWLFPIPKLTVLIDRSYCPGSQWSHVTQNYTNLYRQHQRRQVNLHTVVLFSSLGEEVFSTPPTPVEIHNLPTYGQVDSQREENLHNRYPKTRVLGCYSTLLE